MDGCVVWMCGSGSDFVLFLSIAVEHAIYLLMFIHRLRLLVKVMQGGHKARVMLGSYRCLSVGMEEVENTLGG
jgi:hypothetical protein